MSVTYLHGIEMISATTNGVAVNTVKTAVIGLIGVAPTGDKNALTLCLSATDDAQFGSQLPGFNIPRTLDIIRQGVGNTPILVVNVFDATKHTTAVSNEIVTVTDGAFKLANAPIGVVAFSDSDGDPVEYVKDQDYTLDVYGNFKTIGGTIPEGTVMKAGYAKYDASKVDDSDLIGGTDGSGNRSGLALFEIALNTFGYAPKILISPYFIERPAVSAAFDTLATKLRAIYYIDAPQATTISGAIAGRGVAGTFGFNTASQRAELLFPYAQSNNPYSNTNDGFPFSAFLAAVRVNVDNNLGYWFSTSNKNIPVMTSLDKPVSWNPNDSGSDANQLNGAGISTIAQGYATGFLTWGNRSAAFPASSDYFSFISMRRLDDVVCEAMSQAMLPYLDQPITQAFINIMIQVGNTLLATLIQRGAIQPGSKVTYQQSDNTELEAGKIYFRNTYCGATPAEDVVILNTIDLSLLAALKAA